METSQTSITEGKISGAMISSLRSTKPWTMFLAVLGFISVGLLIIGGIVMMFVQASMMGMGDVAGGARFLGAFTGFMYLIWAILYAFPVWFLFKYSKSVGLFLQSNMVSDMEMALSYQKSFWKFIGILTLVMMIIALIGIIVAIIIPIFVATKAL